jgi:hypothetical protein
MIAPERRLELELLREGERGVKRRRKEGAGGKGVSGQGWTAESEKKTSRTGGEGFSQSM